MQGVQYRSLLPLAGMSDWKQQVEPKVLTDYSVHESNVRLPQPRHQPVQLKLVLEERQSEVLGLFSKSQILYDSYQGQR